MWPNPQETEEKFCAMCKNTFFQNYYFNQKALHKLEKDTQNYTNNLHKSYPSYT